MAGANDGLWDWDIENDAMYLSPRFQQIIGFQDDLDSHFEACRTRLHPEDRDRFDADLHVHLSGESPYFVNEHRLQRQDGSHVWVIARGASVRNANGNAYRIAGSLTDMSQRRKREATALPLSSERGLQPQANHPPRW